MQGWGCDPIDAGNKSGCQSMVRVGVTKPPSHRAGSKFFLNAGPRGTPIGTCNNNGAMAQAKLFYGPAKNDYRGNPFFSFGSRVGCPFSPPRVQNFFMMHGQGEIMLSSTLLTQVLGFD